MKKLIFSLIFLFSFLNLFGQIEEDIEILLNDISGDFGGLIVGGKLSSAWTPGIGHFSASAGINLLVFEFNDPGNENANSRFGLPVYYGELQLGIFNGKEVPMLGMSFFRTAIIGRYGFLPVPEPVGSDAGLKNVPFWSAGLKIGILQGGLLYPDISLSALYTGISRVTLFSENISTVDTSISVSVAPNVISVNTNISKRLFFVTPYIGAGVNFTRLNGRYLINPPSTRIGNGSSGSSDDNSTELDVSNTSFTWKTGVEISFFPFLNIDIETGMVGNNWTVGTGVRLNM